MLVPERRSRADLIAAAAIVVLVIIAATVAWMRSDSRHTESIPAVKPAGVPATAMAVPERVREVWHAPDGASPVPLAVGGAVVTGDNGTVTGRDPRTGAKIWSYQRNMPLCGVSDSWGTAVAVYRDRRGCGEVTELGGSDGKRRAARTSNADEAITLTADGTYVLAQGSRRLEMWRSDLVRTLEYGWVDAPVNPKAQPRSGCTLLSSVSSGTRLAVLERCPKEKADRLTVLNPAPKDNSKPEEYGSSVLAELSPESKGAKLLAANGDRILMYIPGTGTAKPQLGIFGPTANAVAMYPLPGPLTSEATVSRIGSNFSLWTGTQTIALNGTDFAPLWTANGALGPGTPMAGRTLVPVADGIAVLDPSYGNEVARISVSRKYSGKDPITLRVIGNTILEQRGDDVVALG